LAIKRATSRQLSDDAEEATKHFNEKYIQYNLKPCEKGKTEVKMLNRRL